MANETVLFKRGDSVTITSTPVTDGQILFDTSGNGKMYLDNGTDRLEMGGAITVDASLSKTSTNAIQNKAVTGNILNSLAEVSAATQQNTIAGALALKEVNSSLTFETVKYADGVEIDRFGKVRVLRVMDPSVTSCQLDEKDYTPNKMVAGLRISSGNLNGWLQINGSGTIQNMIQGNCLGTIVYLVE